MPPEVMKVTIARTTVRVPVIEDEETTLQIVEQVNDRIAGIEAHAPRIDSMAFALQAAFEFAADLHHAKRDHDAENREVTLAMERIVQSLRDILKPPRPKA